MKILSLIKKVSNNKVFIYMITRYFVYFLQFLTTLLIANKLGPYFMGIWGFIVLLISYFHQCHFGIANSLNVLIVQHKNDNNYCTDIIGNSFILTGYLSILVIVVYFASSLLDISIFKKYQVDSFFLFICIIAILQYVNLVVINVFRVQNRLIHVSFCQSIIIVLNFVGIFFLSGMNLLYYFIFGHLFGNIIILFLAFKSGIIPKIHQIQARFKTQKIILNKGLMLFLYNSCFMFIIVSIKTIISSNYDVKEFGIFAFSFTLGQSVVLLLDTFSFILFPKLIDKLSSSDYSKVKNTIHTIRVGYISTAHLLVYIALIIFPYFLHYFPKYSGSLTTLNLIVLTILMNVNHFGYSSLLIARNKEKTSATISLISLAINIGLGLLFAKIFKVEFSYVIIATMLTYVFFCYVIMLEGIKLINIKNHSYVIKNFFPIRLFLPFLFAFLISIFQYDQYIWIPLFLFLILNISEIKEILDLVKKVVYHPNLINV